MEHTSNEEKAREIGKKYQTPCHGYGDCEFEAYQSAIEAMQWKDKQHAKEKQQWIEKAVIFLNERVCTGMSIPEIHNMIVDFKQAMKGE